MAGVGFGRKAAKLDILVFSPPPVTPRPRKTARGATTGGGGKLAAPPGENRNDAQQDWRPGRVAATIFDVPPPPLIAIQLGSELIALHRPNPEPCEDR